MSSVNPQIFGRNPTSEWVHSCPPCTYYCTTSAALEFRNGYINFIFPRPSFPAGMGKRCHSDWCERPSAAAAAAMNCLFHLCVLDNNQSIWPLCFSPIPPPPPNVTRLYSYSPGCSPMAAGIRRSMKVGCTTRHTCIGLAMGLCFVDFYFVNKWPTMYIYVITSDLAF